MLNQNIIVQCKNTRLFLHTPIAFHGFKAEKNQEIMFLDHVWKPLQLLEKWPAKEEQKLDHSLYSLSGKVSLRTTVMSNGTFKYTTEYMKNQPFLQTKFSSCLPT